MYKFTVCDCAEIVFGTESCMLAPRPRVDCCVLMADVESIMLVPLAGAHHFIAAPSFNGRTADSGSAYRGSNPWGAAKSNQSLTNKIASWWAFRCCWICWAFLICFETVGHTLAIPPLQIDRSHSRMAPWGLRKRG